MDSFEIAKLLSSIDAPDKWIEKCPPLSQEEKTKVFELAEQLWLERMANLQMLFIHPDVLSQLEEQSWIANEIQKKMIWASVLGSADGDDSKLRFKNIKVMLIKKYGNR